MAAAAHSKKPDLGRLLAQAQALLSTADGSSLDGSAGGGGAATAGADAELVAQLRGFVHKILGSFLEPARGAPRRPAASRQRPVPSPPPARPPAAQRKTPASSAAR